MKIKLLIASFSLMILCLIDLPLVSYADGPSIYLSTNVSTVSDGEDIVVAVYMDGGGQPINAVEANLTYPTSQLEYVGLNYSGSPFNISTPGDGGGGGAVSIQNGTISPVSGSALIATVTFKALVGSGSASIGVSGSSSLISANTNTAIPFSPSGASVDFGAGYSASSYASSTSSASSASTPAPAALPPTAISNVKATNLTATTATISWTTNNPTDSVVDFGLDTNYGLSVSSSTMTTSHTLQLSNSFLLPENLMHYKVQGTDASGNVVSASDKTFLLPGLPITIVVYGPNGNPQPNAVVTIDNSTGVTNAKGSVVLAAGYGNKRVTTVYQGVVVSRPITIGKTTKALTSYQLDLAKQPLNSWMVVSIVLIVLVLGLLSLDAMVFRSKIFTKLLFKWRRPVTAGALASEEPVKDTLPEEETIPDTLDHAIEADLPMTNLSNLPNEIDNELNMPAADELSQRLEDLSTPEPIEADDSNFLKDTPKSVVPEEEPLSEREVKEAPPLKINVTDTNEPKPKIAKTRDPQKNQPRTKKIAT